MSKASYADIIKSKQSIVNSKIVPAKPLNCPIANGNLQTRKLTIADLKKANSQMSKQNQTQSNERLCMSVYITRGDDDKTEFATKTFVVQNNTSSNYILEAILNEGKTNTGSYDFSNKKSYAGGRG